MATVAVLLAGTADTGVTPNTSASFTPTAGDLLVVMIAISDTTSTGATLTSSVGGQTFTQINKTRTAFNASASTLYMYVSRFFATAVSQTVTVNPADAGTGSVISVAGVAGMARSGRKAIRQSYEQENQAGGGTPTVVLPMAVLTGNVVIGCVANLSNPAGITPRSSPAYTEGGDVGYDTPTTGFEWMYINSGETASSIAWGGTSATAFGTLVAELDTRPAGTDDIIGQGCGRGIVVWSNG